MCLGGSTPSAPTPPAALPAAPQTPVAPSMGAGVSSTDARRRAMAAGGGAGSTILTSARGIQEGSAGAGMAGTKTLLGQ